jgi:GNAT superfamily N-acetyltransferase
MEIQDLDPARVDEVVAMLREPHRHDHPDDPAYAPRFEKLRILNPFPDEPGTHYVAVDGGRIVGHAELTLPHLDNRTNAILDLTVRPSARRRGVGRRLWEHVAELARSDGRKLIFFDAKMGSPGEAFARALGAELGIFSARRQLIVDEPVRALALELEVSSREAGAGYEVVTFVGATPPEWLEGMAYLTGRMSTDAPLENLELQPEVYDAERLRIREEIGVVRGAVMYQALAVESATRAVVAMTNIGMTREDPTHAWQWNTIVDPDHRGHRLGTWVKVANLALMLAHEPELRTVITWNAASNEHMIAVNELMGFRLLDHWGEWQARL